MVQDLNNQIDLSLDFVGVIAADAASVEDCHTSSGWSECVVNAYHVCAQQQVGWWNYSVCMYNHQYPPAYSQSRVYLECAGLNPVHPILRNQTCSSAEFRTQVVTNISDTCSNDSGLDADRVRHCAQGSLGLTLLKQSMNRSSRFPTSFLGKVEPEWIMVGGPASCSAADGGWSACQSYFDKTDCEDWNHCSSEKWALHIRQRVLG